MGKVVKYCNACEEGFAEKFGFCPNCGALLQAFEMNPLTGKAVEEPQTAPVENIEPAAPPVVEAPAETLHAAPTQQFSEETPETEDSFEFDDDVFEEEEAVEETKAFVAPTPASNENINENLYEATYAKAADKPEAVQPYVYDGGYQPTIVVEKNVKERNTLLLGFFVLGCTLMVGSYVYSIFNKLLDLAAIDTPGLIAYVGEVDPTTMDLEEEEKKEEDKGGGGGGGGKEEQEKASKGREPAQTSDPMFAPSYKYDKVTDPDIAIAPSTKNKNERDAEKSDDYYGLKNGGDVLSDGDGSGGGMGGGKGRGMGNGEGGGIGNGIGDGRGDGRGDGEGDGTGGGRGNFDPDNMQVVKKVVPPTPLKILSKPRANYTDAARQAQVQGKVVLRVTFAANGTIGGISVISGLGNGLTEQAIAAARNIKFEPAKKNGQAVSTVKSIEYTFTIY